jgi:hypothetical protein
MKVQNFGYGVYIGGIIYYNVYSIYFNGKKELTNYRKNNIYFKDEMESVIYGCQKDWYHNLLSSFFWPITMPFKLVPLIIYSLNNGQSEDDIIKKEEDAIKNKNIKVSSKKDLEVIYKLDETIKENIPENYQSVPNKEVIHVHNKEVEHDNTFDFSR